MAEQAYGDEFQTQTVGERLQQAREAKGLSLEDLASQTRIPVRHLQHIEKGEWDALPAITYCVGFVRSYANVVGLDGAVLGREVRENLGGIRPRAPVAEYYQPADPARVPPRSLAIIVGLLIVVLIGGYLIWRGTLDGEDSSTAVTVPVPEAQAPTTQPRPAAPQPQVMAGQPVALVASEEVWVRIDDAAGGTSLYQGTLASGQRFEVPAAAQRPVIRTARPQVLRILVGNRDLGPIEPVERTVSNLSLRAEDLAARVQTPAPAAAPAPALPQ
ncbi:MAG: helix-turn-helix domain-containing protein [Allosphingosinicella sp.]